MNLTKLTFSKVNFSKRLTDKTIKFDILKQIFQIVGPT